MKQQKKTFWEKVGMVERVNPVEEEPDVYEEEEVTSNDTEEVYVETEGIGVENIVHDAYKENGLEDLSKSIYKVGEISKSLPNTIPNAAKRETVLGILATFGLTVEGVSEDARTRYSVLRSVCNKMCDGESSEIKRLTAEIEDLYKAAEAKKLEVQEHENRMRGIINTSQDELKKIKEMWDFITDKENAEEG